MRKNDLGPAMAGHPTTRGPSAQPNTPSDERERPGRPGPRPKQLEPPPPARRPTNHSARRRHGGQERPARQREVPELPRHHEAPEHEVVVAHHPRRRWTWMRIEPCTTWTRRLAIASASTPSLTETMLAVSGGGCRQPVHRSPREVEHPERQRRRRDFEHHRAVQHDRRSTPGGNARMNPSKYVGELGEVERDALLLHGLIGDLGRHLRRQLLEVAGRGRRTSRRPASSKPVSELQESPGSMCTASVTESGRRVPEGVDHLARRDQLLVHTLLSGWRNATMLPKGTP